MSPRAHRPTHALAVAVVSSALAAGAALCLMAGIELTTPRSRAATPPGDEPSNPPTDARHRGERDRILESRLFAPEAAAKPPSEPRADRLAGCDARLRLVATVAARSSSLAAIRAAGEPVQIVRIGAALGDGARVTTIDLATVTLTRADGATCSLALFRDATPAGPDAPRLPVAADDLGRFVRQRGPDEYEISRELVERTLHAPADLRAGRFVLPHEVGGRVVGVKIFGVRPDGLLGRIGLHNGDMLRTINGYELADPYDALEAYARLSRASELSLSLERDGQPRTLRYHVR